MGNEEVMGGELSAGGVMVGPRRWLYAALGLVMLMFMGMIYAWSIFVPSLEHEFGWSRSETSMAFSICMSMFCLGGLAAGLASKRVSFKRLVALAAVFIGLGFFLASRSNSLMGMYVSYGGLVGFGVGMGYNAVLSTMLRWFPDKTGTVSGLMLMGFGAGAMVLGPFCNSLLSSLGWRETFFSFGVGYCLFYLVTSIFVNSPSAKIIFPKPGGGKKVRESGGEVPASAMLRRKSFYIYVTWAVIMNGTGMLIIGHAAPLARELHVAAAAAAVLTGIVSLANGLGRMLGGICFDLFGRNVLMRGAAIGVISCGVLLYFCLQTQSVALITAAFAIAGFCYGMGAIAHSAVTASFYGMKNYSLNFSIITMNTLAASFVGPYLGGVMHTSLHAYTALPYQVMGFGAMGLVLAILLRRP